MRIFAPDDSKIAEIDSPNGDRGDEPIALEAKVAGTYRIEVASFDKDAKPGHYEIRINELARDYAAWTAEKFRKQQAAIAWLKANAIPIKTVEAVDSFQDLQPLKKVFKAVRFVGLGEETHGTREFFQFKHRMVEFLVREMGFRVFVIEASYSACQNINDSVMGKSDDGAKALDSQGFWTWNTEEVRAMLDWMREYNRSVAENKRVKFTGFDIQVNQPGKDKLLPYLKRVAPERAAETESFFDGDLQKKFNPILSAPHDAQYETNYKEATAKLADLKNKYNGLFVFLELNQARLARQTSQAETEQMLEYARVLTQELDGYSKFFADYGKGKPLDNNTRDFYMADNFRRLVEREPAGTRFVIWAHNGHIAADAGDEDGWARFGYHLRQFYGNDYYALGFSFNQGAFQSFQAPSKDITKPLLSSFTVNSAPAESVDWYLAQTKAKNFIVDFRSTRKNAEISQWLAAPHPMRFIGSAFAPNFEQSYSHLTTIGKQYDGLFFIDTTTRARPNPSVKNVAHQ